MTKIDFYYLFAAFFAAGIALGLIIGTALTDMKWALL